MTWGRCDDSIISTRRAISFLGKLKQDVCTYAIQSRLGWSTEVLWLTRPKSLLINSENWNSHLDLYKFSTCVQGKRTPTWSGKNVSVGKKRFFLMAPQFQFLWPFNSSCKLMKSGKSRCCVKLWCGAERNGPPSEAVSTLTSASWDWESWETILQSLQIEEVQTDCNGFFSHF